MAVLQLPTSTTSPFYVFEVILDNVSFRLQFKFNQRDQAWYMDVLDSADNQLRSGLRVVSDWTLLRLWQEIEKRPVGEIIATAQGDIARPALIDELGDEVILTYLDEAEIEAASA
jgi:hypothetical protein